MLARAFTLGLLLAACASAELGSGLLGDVTDWKDCVLTVDEFVTAFKTRDPRCVSPNLLATVSMGPTESDAGLTDATQSLAYFFSGPDVLAKYLRMGYPEMIGLSTPSNASGLTGMSAGLAFLEQVGFPMQYADVSSAYVLNVFTRGGLEAGVAALEGSMPYQGGVGPVSPTWATVRAFFQHAFADADLALGDEALALLQNTSFAALTGCPAQCAYAPSDFPSVNHTTPINSTNPLANGTCPEAIKGSVPAPGTALAADSELCAADWQEAYAAMSALVDNDNCNQTDNAAAGQALAEGLAAAADSPRAQALLFRAFAIQYCHGDFNTLFSGNGFTYTGFNGLLSPLGSELITSPFDVAAASKEPGSHAAIPFCISGTNGGKPNAEGVCTLP